MKYLSIEEFPQLVRGLIREAVEEEMVKELATLKEAAGGTISSTPSISTVGSSDNSSTTGTKPTVGTKPTPPN